MMMRILLLAIATLLPLFAFAAEVSDAVIFSRSVLVIQHQQAKAMPLDDETETQESETKAPTEDDADSLVEAGRITEFDVEARTEKSLYAQDMLLSPDLGDKKGLLIVYDNPGTTPFLPNSFIGSVDVIFLGITGKVLQVMPEIDLRQLDGALEADKAVKATLIIAPAASKTHNILPGDVAQNEIFTKSPVILK